MRYSWTMGLGPFVLPEEAGLLVGEDGLGTVIVEFHYDNPFRPLRSEKLSTFALC